MISQIKLREPLYCIMTGICDSNSCILYYGRDLWLQQLHIVLWQGFVAPTVGYCIMAGISDSNSCILYNGRDLCLQQLHIVLWQGFVTPTVEYCTMRGNRLLVVNICKHESRVIIANLQIDSNLKINIPNGAIVWMSDVRRYRTQYIPVLQSWGAGRLMDF